MASNGNAPEEIPSNKLENILKQAETSICKIKCSEEKIGTGFFCLIPFPDKNNLLPVLVTNNKILTKNDIMNNKIIKFSIKNDEKNIEIKMDNSRKTYSNKQYGITIIEMKKEDDLDFNGFLNIDEDFSNDTSNNIKSIYLIYYNKENKSIYSNGKIKSISDDGNIKFLCSTEQSSSGCPIINLDNYKVIGINKTINKNENCNMGTIIKLPIEKFYEENNKSKENESKNYIKAEFQIGEPDIKKEIRIINSFEHNKKEKKFKDTNEDSKFENEQEIKENCEIKVNGKIIPFNYYHTFKKKGKYTIEYSFKNNITKMSYLFSECTSLISVDFTHFNSQNVTNMGALFFKCASLSEINFTNFNTQNVVDMTCMFSYCSSLKGVNISNFNTENVTNMTCMFSYCSSLKEIDLSKLNTQNVTNMSYMFSGSSFLTNINLANLNTKSVTNMGGMFSGCSSLKAIDISNLNTENVIDMTCIFSKCSSLTDVNLGNINTQNVNNMSLMFSKCNSLENVNLSNLNTQNVNNLSCMFLGCTSLKSLDLSKFNTKNVDNMSYMFSGCSSLTNLDLSNFNNENDINTNGMFSGCTSLSKDKLITQNKKILKEIK